MAILCGRRCVRPAVCLRARARGALWVALVTALVGAGSLGWAEETAPAPPEAGKPSSPGLNTTAAPSPSSQEAVAGEESQRESPPAQPASPPQAGIKPPLSVLWTFSMGADPGSLLAPVVKGDRVFISHDGKLRCLELQTGAEKWKFEPKSEEEEEQVEQTKETETTTGSKQGPRVSTAPLVVGDLVIVGADNSQLYGLNVSDGKQAWMARCGGPIVPSPLLYGDLVMLAAQEMVYAIDPATGKPVWVSALASVASWGPVSDGANLYFLCQDGSVQAVDAERGRLRWRSQAFSGARPRPPMMAEHRVLLASGSTLMAVARTGARSWAAEMPAAIGAQPTVNGNTLYVPCVDGTVLALYPSSGRDLHRKPVKVGSAATAAPLVTGGVVFVGTAGALLYAADLASGEATWGYRCRGPDQPLGVAAELGIYAPIVEADGAILCLTGGGDLFCFSSSARDSVAPRFSDLQPEPASALPSKQAVAIKFVVVDDGSGVDPRSVALIVDGNPTRVAFDPSDGVGEITFPYLPDGSHVVKVTAKDYRGNEGSVEWSFLTDKSVVPEAETRPGAVGTQPARRTVGAR